MNKSLNQLYKESGTTLSYKEWRKREDDKIASFDATTRPSLQDSTSYQGVKTQMQGVKTQLSGKTVLGINKYALIVGGLVIVSAIAFQIYKKQKK
jgi:hypothetical protein